MELALKKYSTINFDIRPPKIFGQQRYWKFVDVRDSFSLNKALNEFQPTHILHLAAMTGMDINEKYFFSACTR